MPFSLELAIRYMRSRKQAFVSVGTVLAIFGVSLGTAALVTALSVTGGFREEFRQKVLGVNAHVLVMKHTNSFPEYREVIETVEKIPGVLGVAPFIINPMMVTHDDRTVTGVLVKGADPERMARVLDVPSHVIEGSLEGLRVPGTKPAEDAEDIDSPLNGREPSRAGKGSINLEALLAGDEDVYVPPEERNDSEDEDLDTEGLIKGTIVPDGGYESELPEDDVLPDGMTKDPCDVGGTILPGALLGKSLKETLGVKLGDCIQITSPTIGYSQSRHGIKPPVARRFRVIGVFDAGFEQYDSKLIYTDLYEAQHFYHGGDNVTGVEMKVADIDNSKEIGKRIEDALDSGIYRIIDWEDLNHGLFTALKIQQIVMSLVLALIILVAVFTVIATLVMVVLEKKKEIAVLKAIGASDGQILRSFLFQGLIIGFGGAVLGLLFGLGLCEWLIHFGIPLDSKVYFISHLPVKMSPWQFLFTGVFAIGVCVVGAIWPARYAAKMRPADAFRDH